MHWVLVSKDPELASTMIGGTAPDTIIACGEIKQTNVHTTSTRACMHATGAFLQRCSFRRRPSRALGIFVVGGNPRRKHPCTGLADLAVVLVPGEVVQGRRTIGLEVFVRLRLQQPLKRMPGNTRRNGEKKRHAWQAF